MPTHNHATACFVGLAIGDALGVTLEGCERDKGNLHTEIIGDPRRNIACGHWTDDTSMALALADSLLHSPSFDAHDMMQRYLRWWRHGEYSPAGRCVDIGLQTEEVLAGYERTGTFAIDDPLYPPQSGNGSLMRLAPVAIRWRHDSAMAIRMAEAQSVPTHPTMECVESCQLLASLLVDLMQGAPLNDALNSAQKRIDFTAPTVAAIATGEWRQKSRDEIRSGGYVIDTLEAALWAIYHSDDFEDALILAVNLAHDADTVGAVTGQLAGAMYGMDAIPNRWLETLAWRQEISAVAKTLLLPLTDESEQLVRAAELNVFES